MYEAITIIIRIRMMIIPVYELISKNKNSIDTI